MHRNVRDIEAQLASKTDCLFTTLSVAAGGRRGRGRLRVAVERVSAGCTGCSVDSHLISKAARAASGRRRAGPTWWQACSGRSACRLQASASTPASARSRTRARPHQQGRAGAGRMGDPHQCPSRPAPPAPRPTGRVELRTAPAWKRPLAWPVRRGLAPRDPASQFYQWTRGPIFGSGARSSANRAARCPPCADVTTRRRLPPAPPPATRSAAPSLQRLLPPSPDTEREPPDYDPRSCTYLLLLHDNYKLAIYEHPTIDLYDGDIFQIPKTLRSLVYLLNK